MTDYEKYYENEAVTTFAQMDYPEQEAITASIRQHDLDLYHQDLANMRAWRDRRCNVMLKIIDMMIQRELDRRYAADRKHPDRHS